MFKYLIFLLIIACVPQGGNITIGPSSQGAFAPAPDITHLTISGSQLILDGSNFDSVTNVTLKDPTNGSVKPFNVLSATFSQLISESLDAASIPMDKALELILSNAYGQSTFPVTFSLQPNSVDRTHIQNGEVSLDKLDPGSSPIVGQVIKWDGTKFIMSDDLGGSGGGSISIGIGSGLKGSSNPIINSGMISVDTGITGDPTLTKIPYFNSTNQLEVAENAEILFSHPTAADYSLFNNGGALTIQKDNVSPAYFIVTNTGTVDVPIALRVANKSVCLGDGTGCPGAFGSSITNITVSPPLTGGGVGPTVNISPGAVNTANNLVVLDGTGGLPVGIKGVVNSVTAGTATYVTPASTGAITVGVVFGTGNAQRFQPYLDNLGTINPNANSVIIGNGTSWGVQGGDTLLITIGAQKADPDLTAIGGLTPYSAPYSNMIVGSGGGWITQQVPNCGSENVVFGDGSFLYCSPNTRNFSAGTLTSYNQLGMQLRAPASGTSTSELHFLGSNNSNYVGLKGATGVASNTIWTLPLADGASGYGLTTDGSGNLFWTSVGGANDVSNPATSTMGNLASFSSITGKVIQDSGIASANVVTMALPALAANRVLTSNGANKTAIDSGVTIDGSNNVSGIQNLTVKGSNTSTPATLTSAVDFMTGRNSGGVYNAGQTSADLAFEQGVAGGGFKHYISTTHNNVAASNLNSFRFYLNNSTTAAGSSLPGTGNVLAMTITPLGVGILNSTPTNALDVTGNTVMTGSLMINNNGSNSYTFPTGRGSNGQVLTASGGAGAVSWATPTMGTVTGTGTDSHIMKWLGTTAAQDSGIIIDSSNNVTGMGTLNTRTIANWVDGPASSTPTNLAAFSGINGKAIQDSGLSTANIPTQAANIASGTLLSSGGSKTITDSGIVAANVVTKSSNFSAPFRVLLALNSTSRIATETGYTIPGTVCPNLGILKSNGTNMVCGGDDNTGDVLGPAGSTTNAIAKYSDGTGNVLANSGVIIDSSNNVSGTNAFTSSGNMTVDTNTFFVDSSGNKVGILTTSPAEALDVRGNARLGSGSAVGALKFYDGNASNFVALQATGTVPADVTWTLPAADGANGQVLSTNASGVLSWVTRNSTSADLVGPGGSTTNAIAKFSDGTGKILGNSGVIIDSSNNVSGTNAFTSSGNMTVDSTTFFVDAANNEVGIGRATNDLYAPLDVVGNIFATIHANTSMHDASEVGSRRIGMKSGNTADGFTGMQLNVKATESDTTTAAANNSDIAFWTWGNGISVSREVMRITERGRLGINTTNPTHTLSVIGNAFISNLADPGTLVGGTTGGITLYGTNGNIAGPHMRFSTAQDAYPTRSFLNWQHDSVYDCFDCYWDGSTWRNSNASSSFRWNKSATDLTLSSAANPTAGGSEGHTARFTIGENGDATFYGIVVAGPDVTGNGTLNRLGQEESRMANAPSYVCGGAYSGNPMALPAGNNMVQQQNGCFAGPQWGPIYTPAVRASGSAFYVQVASDWHTSIATDRTDLTANVAMPSGWTATFISDGTTWLYQGKVPNGVFNSGRTLIVSTTNPGLGSAGQVLTTSGNGSLSWETNSVTTMAITGTGTDGHLMRWKGTNEAQDSGISIDEFNSLTGVHFINGKSLDGIVYGPGSAVDNRVPYFELTSGSIIRDSGILYTDLITKVSDFTSANRVALSSGNNRLLEETAYTIPNADGAANYVLKTNGAGVVSWAADTDSGGDVDGPGSATDYAIALFNGTSGKLIRNSAVTINSNNDITGGRNLNISGNGLLTGTSYIELGSNVSGKEVNAGKIGYNTFASGSGSTGLLNIIGGGTTSSNRSTRFWDRVGIGMDPTNTLDVGGTLNTTGNTTIGGNLGITPNNSNLNFGTWGGGVGRISTNLVFTGGDGESNMSFYTRMDPGGLIEMARIDGNSGNFMIRGSVQGGQFSDNSLKENISDLSFESSLDFIKKLRPVEFKWNAQGGKFFPQTKNEKHYGFIAQDVERILPGMVTKNELSGYKSLEYHEVIPFLVRAVQEQQKTIESLTGKPLSKDNQLGNVKIPTEFFNNPESLLILRPEKESDMERETEKLKREIGLLREQNQRIQKQLDAINARLNPKVSSD